MCGIAGFFSAVDINHQKFITDMIQKLHHRGPDEKGFHIWKNFAIGIARLKIIDIYTGSQPIFNEDGNIGVVLNGEIYNYKELREELLKNGHVFTTNSDTEVLVHLYEEHGENMLSKLNGMFAFAILDKNQEKIFIARDRIGKKPLYFYWDNKLFAFASELKAFDIFFRYGIIKKEIDYRALVNYLIMEYVPSPYTIYKNFSKLNPGHYLVFQNGKVSIRKYWELLPKEHDYSNQKKVIDELYGLLEDSVRIRLRADVPLGVFLSGGIDSSTITYFSKKFVDDLWTFSIRFDEPSYDEGEYIDSVVKHLGVKHFSETFNIDAMRELFPFIMRNLDEPFADPSVLPTYMLSKFAREKVKVALGGDGGDELFAGYPTYQAFFLAKYYNMLPSFIRKAINKLADSLPVSDKNFSFDFKVRKFLSAVEEEPIKRNFLWLGSFSPSEFKNLLIPEVYNQIKSYNPFDEIEIPDEVRELEPLQQILYIDVKYYLQNDILVKIDRASMMCALEVRAPFLDFRVAEFVFSMPVKYKIRFFRTKWILKETMKKYLPRKNIFRAKKGFGIPASGWIKKELKDELYFIFNNIDSVGIFDKRYVLKLFEEHIKNKVNNRKKIWTLLCFLKWFENYMKD